MKHFTNPRNYVWFTVIGLNMGLIYINLVSKQYALLLLNIATILMAYAIILGNAKRG